MILLNEYQAVALEAVAGVWGEQISIGWKKEGEVAISHEYT